MPTQPVDRKLSYLIGLASEDGIALSMEKWLAKLKEIQKEISYDVIWRLLMDLYLKLQLGIDWSQFEFPPIEPPVIPPIIIPPIPPPPPPPLPPTTGFGRFYGNVYDSKTHALIPTASIEGIGATPFTATATAGIYQTGDLQEGPYYMTVTAVGYKPQSHEGFVTKDANTEIDWALVKEEPSADMARIYGAVFERTTGSMIGGGTVSGTGTSSFTATISMGMWDSGDLPVGTYVLSCQSEGYRSVTVAVVVSARQLLKQDFPLDRLDDPHDIEKGVYDVTFYDLCYFDPPDMKLVDIERFAWDHRYHVAEKNTLEYKKQSTALKTLLEAKKDSMKNIGINPLVVDHTESIAAMVESRVLRGFYVGFAVVGLSRVSQKHEEPDPFRARCDARWYENWKDIVDSESVVSHEPLVGYGRVGMFRVAHYAMMLSKQLTDVAVQKINDFWLRSGLVEAGELSTYGGLGYQAFGYEGVYGAYAGYLAEKYKALYPRVFMLQRVDQYHYEGGHHQILLQTVINRVKQICNKAGIIATVRTAYTSYAQEIYYQKHDSHRLWKTWKRLVSVDDITNKYVQMGCDITVLNRIKDAILR